MTPKPPVDLNTPVANPGLVELLIRTKQQPPGDEQLGEVLQQVRNAVYLLASRISHPDGNPPIANGVMRVGSRIEIFMVRTPEDHGALALFTDWPSLRAAVGDDPGWSSLVQTGEEVLRMGLDPSYSGGIVINPNGPEVSFALTPPMIEYLLANTRAPVEAARG